MTGEAMPEQRAAVMIVVDASWQDTDGSLQTIRARMENKSNAGACIRINTEIEPGTAIHIQSFREEFTGVTKYCRIDGKEYLIGIQRHSPSIVPAKAPPRVPNPQPVPQRNAPPSAPPPSRSHKIASVAKTSTHPPPEVHPSSRKVERVTSVAVRGLSAVAKNFPSESSASPRTLETAVSVFPVTGTREVVPSPARMASEMHVLTLVPETPAWAGRDTLQYQDFDVLRWADLQTEQFPEVRTRTEASRGNTRPRGVGGLRERITMQRKWLDMGSWGEKDATNANNSANSTGNTGGNNSTGEKGKASSNSTTPPFAKDRRASSLPVEEAGFQGELLPLEEIYRAAGITTPRGGYSIVKIADMLQSEHLRGLAKDMRRASVMMALDAAGVAINEVLRDAKTRMEAIESYEAEQRKLCEAEWARKEEENIQIRAELERVKAQYIARINRNLEAVAREKARFSAWQTANQQEAQNISDAAELCLKPAAPEPPAPAAVAQPQAPPPAAQASTPASTTTPAPAAPHSEPIKVV